VSHIEPNVTALSWFALLWSVCCLAFLQLSGMYPLRAAGEAAARKPIPLVLGNTLLWLALLAGTLVFAWAQLRWTTIVLVAGILFLFIPALFQVIPLRFRDGHSSMAIAGAVLIAALGVLGYLVAGPSAAVHV
jgi:putative effector of murein hydrolase LrgA (UPF0299 family)